MLREGTQKVLGERLMVVKNRKLKYLRPLPLIFVGEPTGAESLSHPQTSLP